jgi:hypothetical protein
MAKISCDKSGRQLSRASYKTPSKLIARDARYSLREMSLDSYKGACTARKSPQLQAKNHLQIVALCSQMRLLLAVRTLVD